MNSNFESKEAVLNIKENSIEKCNNEKKAEEIETSLEGLTLKELPIQLKYAFLELEKAKPVIILAALTELEEQKLLEILRKYKEVITWSIEDLKRIIPSICMHKICLEDNTKTSIKKIESSNERSYQKRSTETTECRLHICNLRQHLGEPSSCGS